ncbi:uroporphyrinogen-III synthase [Granulicella tundricola]|uniref:Uroporphyrinogen-III synthase n=1 Tax=Granulicella tundricola (strain ATCC BAA-1859 / DSM 23138 / MP5ACTX9) TaxID=1198114 RepID=E8WXP2_GRATM|nr:uroporphyrinogen-III synthase [Granulicella tundricola]ADW68658.1 Uroporphyrinogen III synthase HEM4 [Granulicella tundricola MP5ACTX9]
MPAPLQDRRILITRAAGQASTLATLLAERGAIPILIPTIELAPPTFWQPLDQAIQTIQTYDWLLFTSANAVEAYVQRARTLNLPAQARRIAAIGPATARAVQGTGLAQAVDLIPARYVAESFAEALLPHAPNARMILVRAAEARDHLTQTLMAAGAHLTIAEAYRTIVPPASIEALKYAFSNQAEPLDAITFTSASTARNLATLMESAALLIPHGTTLASIGPITSQAMRDLNLTPTIEAKDSTIPSLVEALTQLFIN